MLFTVRFRLLRGHLLGIAAYLVDHMFSLYFDYLYFFSRGGKKFKYWVLIAQVPDPCLLLFVMFSKT